MNDYLSLLPSTLQWIAGRLDAVSPIPWPLWIGGLFPIYLGVVSSLLWFLRGRVWPVHCAYPRTSKGRPCRNWVTGEWQRCRHHNRPRKYRYGHEVVAKIQRWQTLDGRDRIVDRAERGVGVLRLRAAGSTLLYEKGYARPFSGVVRLLPTKVRAGFDRLRQARLRGSSTPEAVPAAESEQPAAPRTDIARGLEQVVRATQFATVAFCAAIALSIVALFGHGNARTIIQYIATLGFVLAWAATSSGIYSRDPNWLRGACRKSLRWWAGIFVPVALINLVFTAINTFPR